MPGQVRNGRRLLQTNVLGIGRLTAKVLKGKKKTPRCLQHGIIIVYCEVQQLVTDEEVGAVFC